MIAAGFLRRSDFWSRLLCACLVSFVAVVGLRCLSRAVDWIDRPFPGFLAHQNGLISFLTQPHWSGPVSGIRFPDRVIAVNGRVPSGFPEVIERVRALPLGARVRYTVENRGRFRDVVVPTARFDARDFWTTFGILFVSGALCVALGVVVFLLRPGGLVGAVFLVFACLIGLWSVTKFDHVADYRFGWTVSLASAFLPVGGMHFALAFPERRAFTRLGPAAQLAPYGAAAFLFAVLLFAGARAPRLFLIAQQANLALGAMAIVVALVAWLRSYLGSGSPVVRQRAKVFLFGPLLSAVPALVTLGANAAGWSMPFNVIGVSLFFASLTFTYAILKHNIFDIHLVLQRALTYAGTLLLVTVAYLVFVVAAQSLLRDLGVSGHPAWNLAFLAAMVLLFDPLRRWVGRVVDRTLFPSRREFREVIGALTKALPRLLDPDAVISRILDTIGDALGVRRAYVMLYGRDGAGYRLYWLRRNGALAERSGEIDRGTGRLFQELRQRKAIAVSNIEADIRYGASRDYVLSRLRALEVELIIALERRAEVVGYVLLGEKRDGTLYSSEDVELLKVMADQAAIALENARLCREREELARDLHDCAIQSVYALKLQAELVGLLLAKDVERATGVLEKMGTQAEEVMRTLRGYASRMGAAGEDGADFLPRAQELIRRFEEARSLKIAFEIEGEERLREMPELLAHLFPILQEGITNAMKHARASRVEIRLTADERGVRLSISNDGRRAPPDLWSSVERDGSRHGLRNMRERARELGGELAIEGRAGVGMVLTLSVPRRPEAAPVTPSMASGGS